MITESKIIAQVGSIVYDTPNEGETIYAREHGSSHRTQVFPDFENVVVEVQDAIKIRDRLLDIVMLSKRVPALKEQLDKLETLYFLVKNENNR